MTAIATATALGAVAVVGMCLGSRSLVRYRRRRHAMDLVRSWAADHQSPGE